VQQWSAEGGDIRDWHQVVSKKCDVLKYVLQSSDGGYGDWIGGLIRQAGVMMTQSSCQTRPYFILLVRARIRRHSTRTLVFETVGTEGVDELALIWFCCAIARGRRLAAEDISAHPSSGGALPSFLISLSFCAGRLMRRIGGGRASVRLGRHSRCLRLLAPTLARFFLFASPFASYLAGKKKED